MAIVDLSKYQLSNKIDWSTFSKNVDLLICRVQYGSTGPDPEYNNHIANAKKYNIKFNTYTFPHFVSVNDARVEARDAYSRADKDSEVIWLDVEAEFDTAGNPVGITKLSPQVRLDGIKAYVDELRKQGAKKVGGYIANNIYRSWNIQSIIDIFDAIWIPKYSTTCPDYPHDLWQYTEKGSIPGYSGPLDISKLMGSKPLSFFTGVPEVPEIKWIYTGGYAGPALLKIHNYLFSKGHGFDVKRGPDGSIIFLVGPFDTSMPNWKECYDTLIQMDSHMHLLTPDQAADWRK